MEIRWEKQNKVVRLCEFAEGSIVLIQGMYGFF